VFDTRYTGGKIGVTEMQDGTVIWSNVEVKCVERYTVKNFSKDNVTFLLKLRSFLCSYENRTFP